MSVVIGIIIGLLMLMLLVTAHELGHFIVARRNGVEVEEFGICFPPRAIAWRKVDGKWRRLKRSEWKDAPGQGTIISLNWIPIGGFCQMKGESDAEKTKGSFGAAKYWAKTKILFGGVLANWILAFLIFTALAYTGMPHFIENQFQIDSDIKVIPTSNVTVTSVVDGSPAKTAGLKEGDEIISIMDKDNNRSPIQTSNGLLEYNDAHKGETIYVSFIRDGDYMTAEVKLNGEDAEYLLGAGIYNDELYLSSWSSPIVGIGLTAQLTGETFKGVGKLIVDLFGGLIKQVNTNQEVREEGSKNLAEAGDAVTGPVGIVGVLFPMVMQRGGEYLFFLVALISISLACMNVLPIPALDGGRWFLITLYRLRKKKLTKEKEEKIVSRAFIVILVLAVIITILDITRIIG